MFTAHESRNFFYSRYLGSIWGREVKFFHSKYIFGRHYPNRTLQSVLYLDLLFRFLFYTNNYAAYNRWKKSIKPYSIFHIPFSATIGYSNKLLDPRYVRNREMKFFIRNIYRFHIFVFLIYFTKTIPSCTTLTRLRSIDPFFYLSSYVMQISMPTPSTRKNQTPLSISH